MPAHTEPHIPIGRLDDGTPVYATPGRLTVVDGWRRGRCHACGALLARISADHLIRHGLTPDDYRSRYGLPRPPSRRGRPPKGTSGTPPTRGCTPAWPPSGTHRRRRARRPLDPRR